MPQVNPDDAENYPRMIEMWFLFSLIWSVCASVDEDSRKKIDTLLREMESQFPAKVSNIKTHKCLHTFCRILLMSILLM